MLDLAFRVQTGRFTAAPRRWISGCTQDDVWDQLFFLRKQIKGASYAWASPPTAPAGTIKGSEYQSPHEYLTEADSLHGLLSKGHCCWEVGIPIHLSIQ